MEFRVLSYFVAVAEELHFGRAAQRVFIAQPSLSAQIRKLETELGAPLFNRNHHHVTLTAAGRALLGPARAVLDAAGQLPAIVAAVGRHGGQLRLGFVPYAKGQILTCLTERFVAHRPDAALVLRAGNDSPEVFKDLREGRIDAGILRGPVSAPWATSVHLGSEPFVAAIPTNHRLAHRKRIRLIDLRDDSFALFARELNPPAFDHLMTFFQQGGFTPTIGHTSRRMDDSLSWVATGNGVGLFPISVASTTGDPAIAFVALANPTPTVDIELCWDTNTLNPHVGALAEVASANPVPGTWTPDTQSNQRDNAHERDPLRGRTTSGLTCGPRAAGSRP